MQEPRRSLDDVTRLRATAEFFGERAAGWDAKFGDDMPAYRAAVARADYPVGSVVADLGCGTGRALPALCEAVGPAGRVLGVEVTLEMLAEVRRAGRDRYAHLLLTDALALPLPDATLGGIFAAGLLNHVPEADAGLRELARATRPGGRLAIFHPTGRRALAARHGHELRGDEPLAEGPLRAALAASGWTPVVYDDAVDHFFALAHRVDPISASD
ncbi:MAG TPA: methyltransferase domain-containing protein [Sporichthyaceae bacterium]